MRCLELAPGVQPKDVGFDAVTQTVTRMRDRWTVHLVDTSGDKCQMLAGDKDGTGSAPLLGWIHSSQCELTLTRIHGVGKGKCDGGRAS